SDGTGLYFYRDRYYSPALDRFLSEDPLGWGGGSADLYLYVLDDPVDYSDPFGDQPGWGPGKWAKDVGDKLGKGWGQPGKGITDQNIKWQSKGRNEGWDYGGAIGQWADDHANDINNWKNNSDFGRMMSGYYANPNNR